MNSEGKTDPKETILRGSRRSRERVLFQLEETRKPSDFTGEDPNEFQTITETEIDLTTIPSEASLKTAVDGANRVKITGNVRRKRFKAYHWKKKSYKCLKQRLDIDKIHAELGSKLQAARIVNGIPTLEPRPHVLSPAEFAALNITGNCSPYPSFQSQPVATLTPVHTDSLLIRTVARGIFNAFLKSGSSLEAYISIDGPNNIKLEIRKDSRCISSNRS
uniref:Uncharacterized protein n=1 Tax=Acrobeloides nanus TaxID=290746 RepID=A0A914DKF0_9BILA